LQYVSWKLIGSVRVFLLRRIYRRKGGIRRMARGHTTWWHS
jgi:hypothetical protein